MSTTINDVIEERKRQDDKCGQQNHHPIIWMSILTEEVGEAAKEANDIFFANAQRIEQLREELVQVAAVAIAAIESLDRGLWK